MEKEAYLGRVRNLDLATQEGRHELTFLLAGMDTRETRIVDASGKPYFREATLIDADTEDLSQDFRLKEICSRINTPENRTKLLEGLDNFNVKTFRDLGEYFGHELVKKGMGQPPHFFSGNNGELFGTLASAGFYSLAQTLNMSPLGTYLARLVHNSPQDLKGTKVHSLLDEFVRKTLDFEKRIDDLSLKYIARILKDRDFKLPPSLREKDYESDMTHLRNLFERTDEEMNISLDRGKCRSKEELIEASYHSPFDVERVWNAIAPFENQRGSEEVESKLIERVGEVNRLQEMVGKYFSE